MNKKLNFNPQGADISALYMDDGYLFFNINPVEVAVSNDSIDVEMRIYEGAQATLDKITVSGNDKTNDYVILRQMWTHPGQKFSRSDIIRTQSELAQLGYFDQEQITPNVVPDPVNETADIEWQLVERSNDQVQLSGGWGGAFGFVGTLGVTFNNFSVQNITKPKKWRGLPVGDGQSLGVSFQANGRTFQSYSISFQEPWLGGRKPNSLGLSFSKSIQRSINRITDQTLGWAFRQAMPIASRSIPPLHGDQSITPCTPEMDRRYHLGLLLHLRTPYSENLIMKRPPPKNDLNGWNIINGTLTASIT